jgi:hypothetical protein
VIWLLDGFHLSRLDDEGKLLASLEIAPAMERDSAQLVSGAGAVWVAAGHANLFRVDRDRVSKILDIGYHLDGLAASDTALFVSNDRWGGRIYRIDPRDTRIDLAVEGQGHQLRFGGGALWASWKSTVNKIDPKTLKVEATIDLGGYVSELVWGMGALFAVTLDRETAGTDDERSRLFSIDGGVRELAQLRGRPGIAVGDGLFIDDGTLCRWDGALTRFEVELTPCVVRKDEVWGIGRDGTLMVFQPSSGALRSLGLRGHAVAT